MERGFAGPQGVGMGQENFSHHAGRDRGGARQNLAGQGRTPHPSNSPYPIAIPMCAIRSFVASLLRELVITLE